jgi:hypothetical protein
LNEASGGVGSRVDAAARGMAGQVMGGQTGGSVRQQAKEFMGRHPGLAEAGQLGVAAFCSARAAAAASPPTWPGLAASALVSGLAYKASRTIRPGAR